MQLTHSDKALKTISEMKTVPSDWGRTEIKWEKRRIYTEVWVLCPVCAGSGKVGSLKGKVVPSHEAHNGGARETIRPCETCPRVPWTRNGRTWYWKDGKNGEIGNDRHHGSPDRDYREMNGLVREWLMVEKEVGIVQWAEGTKFDSRFSDSSDQCQLCAKVIPSQRFCPVTGKGADGMIHGMWIGEDCAKKFFQIKNFKKDQVVIRKETV